MNIDFTKKEYEVLLDMLSVADWVMHAFVEDETKHSEEHVALKKKLFSYFKEMGEEKRIEFAPELNDFFETREYEQHIQKKFISPYEDQLFWELLSDKLAERDLVTAVKENEEYAQLKGNARFVMYDDIKQTYINEFQGSGLEHLAIRYDNLVRN